jgi:hypothetical protein
VDQRGPIEQNVGEGSTMTTTEADAEAEAQAHSRTILAALMSDADINQALASDWMHQDEQDGEMSQGISNSNHIVPHHTGHPIQEESADQSSRPTPAHQEETVATGSEPGRPGMAVSLHAEMERHLRDDLATTKIAIDQVEKELAVLRGAIDPGSEEERPTYVSPLPANITSSDLSALDTLMQTLQNEHHQFEERLPVIKDKVASLMNSRVSEAERLKTLLLKLKVDEDDKAAIDKILRPLSTHLDGLLQSLAPEVSTVWKRHFAPCTDSSARGRPTRHSRLYNRAGYRTPSSWQTANVSPLDQTSFAKQARTSNQECAVKALDSA